MRFFKIIYIVIHYRLDEIILSMRLLKKYRFLLYLRPWHYIPYKKRPRGEQIRKAFEDLGPIFVKFGQALSTRMDLLPEDIGNELKKLQDNCTPFDGLIAKKMIEESLGDSTDKLFKKFDIAPLASASIAQVHTATTLNGNEVVVKVLRPNVKEIIQRDISLMLKIAKFIDKYPISKKIRPIEIVSEFEDIIMAELDLEKEAQNCEKIGNNFKNSELLYVPKIYKNLSNKNVLTIERIYGIPVGNIDELKANNIDLKRLAENGVIIFFTQVFKHNFFHADMHPGNIFVGKNGQYMGVDFGIMGSLTKEDKGFLADIFLAFFNQDYKGVAKSYIDAGWASFDTNEVKFEKAIEKICSPMFAKSLGDISFGQVLIDLMQTAKDFDISVQPQLLLLDKTLLNIEGLGRQLYANLDLWATAKPFLEELVEEQYSSKTILNKIKTQTPDFLKKLPDLPEMGIDTIKNIEKIQKLGKINFEQNKAILKQLENNRKSQKNTFVTVAILVVLGIFLIN